MAPSRRAAAAARASTGGRTPGGEEKLALAGAPPAASGLSPAADPGAEGSATPRAPPENVAYVRPRYFRWAELLGRVFEFDIMVCPDCGGRLRLLATIDQPGVIEKILGHLGLPVELPSPAPARSPAWLPGWSD